VFTDATIVGEGPRATAVIGQPRQGRGDRGWKEPIRVAFVFRNDGLTLRGTADVTMGGVAWVKFRYDLEKKRSRKKRSRY
jgi:hypothetical protein